MQGHGTSDAQVILAAALAVRGRESVRADRKHGLAANDDEEEKGETKGKESELARELKIVKEEAIKVDENRRLCRCCCCC